MTQDSHSGRGHHGNSETDVNSMVIRTARHADLPQLQRIFRAASLSNSQDVAELLAHPEYLEFSGDGLSTGATRVAAVPGEGQEVIVGFATVQPGGQDGDEPELEDLFVDPGWRRRGVARRLVVDAVETVRAADQRSIVVTGNEHALPFYRAAGFVEFGSVVTELGSPAPRLRLAVTA